LEKLKIQRMEPSTWRASDPFVY